MPMLAVKAYNNDLNIFRRTMRLMGNRFEISVVGSDPIWADNCIDAAVAEITRVEKLLSAFSDDSQINEINRNAGIKPVKIDAEIFRLIDRSLKISELTHGAFDITYYANDKEVITNFNKDSDLADTKIAISSVNYHNVILDPKA